MAHAEMETATTPADRRPRGAALALALVAATLFDCAPRKRAFPWPLSTEPAPASHAEVETLNAGYDRQSSTVLVRRVKRATRANLDYAAYHANVMILDPPPEGHVERADPNAPLTPEELFDGSLDPASFTASLAGTPLTDAERRQPMAFAPLVDALARWSYQKAGGLEDVRAAVRTETWGGGGGPHIVRQRATLAYLHRRPDGGDELWLMVEMQPWFDELDGLPDEDGDGFAQFYGKVRDELVGAEAFTWLHDEYAGKTLDRRQVDTWANELGSYWYPSYNTDLVAAGASWPDVTTEPEIVATLGSARWPRPTVIMLGKPQGAPVYSVFLVDGLAAAADTTGSGGTRVASTGVTPDPKPLVQRIEAELAAHGGTWGKWYEELQPFYNRTRRNYVALNPELKAFSGIGGFLFYRASVKQMLGGDFRKQPKGKDPFPVIVEFQKVLAAQGVDFLFVPVPTKAAVFPDKLTSVEAKMKGEITTPFERKFLRDLAEAGVEVVDLLPRFLAERNVAADDGQELYLAQDTHWTDRGLRLAAEAIAERVKRYPWYKELAKEPVAYGTKKVTFNHAGDLPSRLAAAEQKPYGPLELLGTQVLTPSGELYEDLFESPITVLGDSFTGVYQRTFCRNAGLSAHLARELSTPVDLVMSYGGGPNVRKKILRRGEDAFKDERLIIWVMAARDLYDYWEDWELLEGQ